MKDSFFLRRLELVPQSEGVLDTGLPPSANSSTVSGPEGRGSSSVVSAESPLHWGRTFITGGIGGVYISMFCISELTEGSLSRLSREALDELT